MERATITQIKLFADEQILSKFFLQCAKVPTFFHKFKKLYMIPCNICLAISYGFFQAKALETVQILPA